MRLNGWQRIGVVASVIRILVGPPFQIHRDVNQARVRASLAMTICMDAGIPDVECAKDYPGTYATFRTIKLGWGTWGLLAFVPILVAWLVAWVVFVVIRWIRAGFSSA